MGFSDYRFVFFVVFVANADASMKAFQTAARGTARSKMVRAGTLAQRAGIHALARSPLKHKARRPLSDLKHKEQYSSAKGRREAEGGGAQAQLVEQETILLVPARKHATTQQYTPVDMVWKPRWGFRLPSALCNPACNDELTNLS